METTMTDHDDGLGSEASSGPAATLRDCWNRIRYVQKEHADTESVALLMQVLRLLDEVATRMEAGIEAMNRSTIAPAQGR
jgi:hypothetical protein